MMGRFALFLCCLLVMSACAAKKMTVSNPVETESQNHAQKDKAWQRPYTVNGRRYEPLPTHVGFVQTGIASWYGLDFHGKTTSSGERYDMNAMTAAHKTLPLGVYVKVHNEANGNETVVRINDRGPFVKGRIIDLSYAAARKLGVDVVGTAPVRIEALGYKVEGAAGQDSYRAPENYDTGNYTVQVGSFMNYTNAQRLSAEMKRRYAYSEIRQTDINGSIFYRVYAGKYGSLKEAEAAQAMFESRGYPGSFAVSLD